MDSIGLFRFASMLSRIEDITFSKSQKSQSLLVCSAQVPCLRDIFRALACSACSYTDSVRIKLKKEHIHDSNASRARFACSLNTELHDSFSFGT